MGYIGSELATSTVQNADGLPSRREDLYLGPKHCAHQDRGGGTAAPRKAAGPGRQERGLDTHTTGLRVQVIQSHGGRVKAGTSGQGPRRLHRLFISLLFCF